MSSKFDGGEDVLQIKDTLKAVGQEAGKVLMGLRKWKTSGLESKRGTRCK